ncbi:MAG: enoyl-CoA hydratase/isomerase family protein [Pseudomonadota bacterium]
MAFTQETEGVPIIEEHGRIGRITFNRPSVRNRIHPEDIDVVVGALRKFEEGGNIRVVIISGRGKVFCSGFDLNTLKQDVLGQANEAQPTHRVSSFARLPDAIERCSLPTILEANGSIYGGGTDIALACDFRFGVEGLEALLPASRLGVHLYETGLVRFISQIGLSATKRMCLAAEALTAEELLACGFFDAVLPIDEMRTRVDQLANSLCERAPLSVQGMKRTLYEITKGELDTSKPSEAYLRCLTSEDLREGVSAWFEKRKAEFRGR